VTNGCQKPTVEETTTTRGSKVFKLGDMPESNASSYPEPFMEG
jgi:hypothetical protein